MNTLCEEFKSLEIAAAQSFRNLTVFPLLRADAGADPGYVLLCEAVAAGEAAVVEVSAGGAVPSLLLKNRSKHPVMLLDGEELVGAKQNRIMNLTILAPPGQDLVIPVSCVEAGRWSAASPEFKVAQHAQYPAGRAARTAQVTESMINQNTRYSDQAAVWSDIAEKAERMAAPSPTSAMHAMYEKQAAPLEEYLRAFQIVPRQAGMIFAMSGEIKGMDLFDHPATMSKLFAKLIRSYALDALDAPMSEVVPSNARGFLEALSMAPCFVEPAVGMGKDIRMQGAGVSGAGLWVDSRYLHLYGFARRMTTDGVQTNVSRPSRRRPG
jgi:hypothetical protein